MTHTANCIRMAFAINTAHTFSINQMFSKLCQKRCDLEECYSDASYIDVFTLSRRCLSTGPHCQWTLGPRSKQNFEEHFLLPDRPELPARNFRAVIGDYVHATMRIGQSDDLIFYDYGDLKASMISANFVIEGSIPTWERDSDFYNNNWSLCSTTAPWLSFNDSRAVYGVYCDICWENLDHTVSVSIGPALDLSDSELDNWLGKVPEDFGDLKIPYMTVEDYRTRVKEEHSGLEREKA